MTDQVVSTEYRIGDGVTATANSMAGALNRMADAAEVVETKVTAVSASVSALKNRFDPVANASRQVAAALRNLNEAQTALKADMATGGTTAAEYERTIAALQARVDLARAKLKAAQAAASELAGAHGDAAAGASRQAEAQALLTSRIDQAAQAAQRAAAYQQALNTALNVHTGGSDNYARRAADVEAYGQELDRLRAKFNPLFAVSKRYEETLAEIAQAQKVGAISAAEAAAAQARATAEFEKACAPVDKLANSAKTAAHQHGQLALQINDVVTSLGSGMPVMQVAIQQGGQITQIYGGVAGTFRALVSAVGAVPLGLAAVAVGLGTMAVHAERVDSALVTMQNALRATRADADALGESAARAAKAWAANSGASSGTDAAQAAQTLAGVSTFSGSTADLQRLLTLSEDVAAVWGKELPDAAKTVADAMRNPAETIKQLAQSGFPAADAATVRWITSLQEAGDVLGAQEATLRTLQKGLDGAHDHTTPLTAAMRELRKAAYDDTGGESFITALGRAVNTIGATCVQWLADVLDAMKAARRWIAENVLHINPDSPSLLQRWTGANTGTSAGTTTGGGTAAATRVNNYQAALPADVRSELQAAISAASSRFNVDSGLVSYLQSTEGAWKNGAWQPGNGSSARGAMQVLSGTAAEVTARHGITGSQTDTTTSVMTGTAYLSELLDQFGDPALAIVAYKIGPGLLRKILDGDNTLTAEQAKNVQSAYALAAGYSGTGRNSATAAAGTQTQLAADDASVSTYAAKNEALARHIALLKAAQAQVEAGSPEWQRWQEQINADTDAINQNNIALAKQVDELSRTSPAFAAKVAEMDREQDATISLTVAYGRSWEQVNKTTASTKAYTDALAMFGRKSPQFQEAVDALTVRYESQARQAADLVSAQESLKDEGQIEYLRRQIELVGTSEDVRTRELAVLAKRNEILQRGGDLNSEESQRLLEQTARVADLTTAYQHQQSVMQELQSMGTQVFDQLGSSITSAFANGNAAAINWKNITKAAMASVLQEIAKLSVLNPISNYLFGTGKATLSDVSGLLGGTSLSSGSASSGGGSSALGTLSNGTSLVSSGAKLFGFDLTGGLGGSGSLFGSWGGNGVSGLLSGATGLSSSTVLWGTTTAEATNAALAGMGAGVYGPATSAEVSSAASSLGGTTLGSVGSALGGLGAGFGLGSMVGGMINSHHSDQSMVGAGIGATAGMVFGPIGSVVGGLVGGIAGSFFGPGKTDSTAVGKLNLANGTSWASNGKKETSETQSGRDTALTAMAEAASKLTALVGSNSGADIAIEVGARHPSALWFNDGRGTLTRDQTSQGDTTEIVERFKDKLVSTFYNATGDTKQVLDASKGDYDRAVAGLTFLNDTYKTLTTDSAENIGSLQEAINEINNTYNPAIATARDYGLATDKLVAAQKKATEAAAEQAHATIEAVEKEITQRRQTASGVYGSGLDTTLATFDASAQEQRDAWAAQLKGVYGDAYEATSEYARQVAMLNDTLAAERDKVIADWRAAYDRGLANFNDNLAAREATLRGDSNAATLLSLQVTQREEIVSTTSSLQNLGMSSADVATSLDRLRAVQEAERQATIKAQQEQAQAARVSAAQNAYTSAQAAFQSTQTAYVSALNEQITTAQDQITAQKQAVSSLRTMADALAKFRTGLDVADSAPTTPAEKLAAAQRQFDADLAAARKGDTTAASALQGDSNTLLSLAQSYYGKATAGYGDVFRQVTAALDSVVSQARADADGKQLQVDTAQAQLDVLTKTRDEAAAVGSAIVGGLDELKAAFEQGWSALLAAQIEYGRTTGTTPNPSQGLGGSTAAVNQQYVESLYRSVLGRESDAQGRAYWLSLLNSGAITPAGMSAQFQNSAESIVQTAYRQLLGRGADAEGYEHFRSALVDGRMTAADLRAAIVSSAEYQGSVANTVASLYQTVLRRGADAEGYEYFRSALASGRMTAADIRAAMLTSPEYQAAHRYAAGGWVTNGRAGVDSVLAHLAGGEFVMPAEQAARYGDSLQQMRQGTYAPSNDNGADLRAELKALREEVARLRAETQRQTRVVAEGATAVRDAVQEGNTVAKRQATVSRLKVS